MPSSAPRIRPLIVRPGARFRCFGDGLCCTDIHALGPISRAEAREMREISRLAVFRHPDLEGICLRPREDGRCHFEREGLCVVHERFGAEAKPIGCRRFPFGLVKTPLGGRITTEHRCPCRTLGTRPTLSLALAEQSLRDRAGRLQHDSEAPRRIALTRKQRVPFERYAEIEGNLLRRLARGERAEDVLDAEAFPRLRRGSWAEVARSLIESEDTGAGGHAHRWFGDAIATRTSRRPPPARGRPWAAAFERGTARSEAPARPDEVINDWIADELWMMRALQWRVPFDVARAELATRLAVAREVERRLASLGVRHDQAAAEAVMVAEIALHEPAWARAVRSIESPPGRSVLLPLAQ